MASPDVPQYLAADWQRLASEHDDTIAGRSSLLAEKENIEVAIAGTHRREQALLNTMTALTVGNTALDLFERSAWDLALRRGAEPIAFEDRLALFRKSLGKLNALDELLRQSGIPLLVIPEDTRARRSAFTLYQTTGTGLQHAFPESAQRGTLFPDFNFGVEYVTGDQNFTSGYDAHDVNVEALVAIHTGPDIDRHTAEIVQRGGGLEKIRFLGQPAIDGLIGAAQASPLRGDGVAKDRIRQLEQATNDLALSKMGLPD